MKPSLLVSALVTLALGLLVACQQQAARGRAPLKPPESQTEVRALPANSSPNLKLVIDGAISQVGLTTGYDQSYQRLAYPNGDVPIEVGSPGTELEFAL